MYKVFILSEYQLLLVIQFATMESQVQHGADCIINEESVQQIIAELILDAPCQETKNCLKTYTYGKTVKQLNAAFNTFSQETLAKTLDYLNIPNRIDYVKASNVDSIICRIQNLLPDTCGLCEEIYCVKNNDKTLLSCAVCGQEAHHKCLRS